jgi:endonuclease/exonuclease/phosphatase family metal-dependent hydrolase
MTELTALSYNVRGLRDDFAALQRVIRGSGAHLVYVQEVPRYFRWRSRAADLARRCDLVVVNGGATAAGNLLMCDLAVTVHRTRDVLLPRTTGRSARGAALAELSLAGRRLTAVGTHLGGDAAERERHARMLLDLAGPDGAPLVLGGDLDEAPGGAAAGILSDRLVDAAVAVGDGEVPTFPAASPHRRVDYVWADPRVRVLSHEVLDSADARVASDHLPIRVRLDLG